MKRFTNTPPIAKLPLSTGIRALISLAFPAAGVLPSAPLPSISPDWQQFFLDDGIPRYIWFGHSTLLARIGGLTLLFDPIFGKSASQFSFYIPRFAPPAVDFSALPPIDICLISHNHYDHLEKAAIAHLATRRCRFLCPEGLSGTLAKWGADRSRITEMPWQNSCQFDGLSITALPARHYSSRGLTDYGASHWCSWALTTSTDKIYFSGDSSYADHFAAIGKQYGGFDIAFIENGQYDAAWPEHHMFPEQSAQAAGDLKTAVYVPIHWGMFALARHAWQEPPAKSVPLVENQGITALTPRLGEVFSSTSCSTRWWEGL